MSRGLSAGELLGLADAGASANAGERGLLLLGAAMPEHPLEALRSVGLGARDALILELRCRTLGDTLTARVSCPACRLLLGVEVEREEVERPWPAGQDAHGRLLTVAVGDVVVEARTPDGDALLEAACQADVEGARDSLVTSCVAGARVGGEAIAVDELDPDVIAAVGEAILDADPQAEVHVELTCAGCGHEWSPVLDIALFFWQELRAASVQILDDVHQLAAGYGWSEEEVLKLSARRRRRYVERLLDA